jgi:hypothetical protein
MGVGKNKEGFNAEGTEERAQRPGELHVIAWYLRVW